MRAFWRSPGVGALVLGLPGLWALYGIAMEGPRAWGLSQTQPWGIPVAAFVFWVGLAHAGTFFSAVLLLLNKPWRTPLALAAERMTLAALGATALYPVLHLGLPTGALWMIPRVDSAGMGLELKSPLFWDFMAIGAYSMVSLAYYHLDRLGAESEAKRTRIRAMAWVLLPLVLTVHTIVSLDFATARVPSWGFAELPLYFIAGALYSGVAAILFWSAFQKNMPWKKLVDLLLGLSWIMAVFWLFLAQKGHGVGWWVWGGGFIIPQLLWVPWIRGHRGAWMGISLGVLGALFWERLELVWLPMRSFQGVDLGWLCLGGAVFLGLFAFLSRLSVPAKQAIRPCGSKEALGVWGAGLFLGLAVLGWWKSHWGLEDYWALGPVVVPLVLLLVGGLLWIRAFFWTFRLTFVFGGLGLILGALVASVLLDLSPQWESRGISSAGPRWGGAPERSSPDERSLDRLWQGYCYVCHGATGFERMPMRKHYPYALTPRSKRWDAMGVDSLTRVVLEGRGYMNAYADRLSAQEARDLVLWMRQNIQHREEAKHD